MKNRLLRENPTKDCQEIKELRIIWCQETDRAREARIDELSWKFKFKTEVCSKSADPHLTMHWIKEVEIAKLIDDLMTSQSIT